jgi:FtsZ-binding cell division protein ZapB
MQRRTVERIQDWPSRPFPDSDGGLRDLATADFCGVVHAGAWLFMYDGRCVGVFDGTIEDFTRGNEQTTNKENETRTRTGTIYTSPEPTLPVLFAMQEREPIQREHYHTDQTAVETVTRFFETRDHTGYIELCSSIGEYYIVYDNTGVSRIAYVGSGDQLLTGDRADTIVSTSATEYTVAVVSLDSTDGSELPRYAPPEQERPELNEREQPTGALPSGRDEGRSRNERRTKKRRRMKREKDRGTKRKKKAMDDSPPKLVADGSSESIEHLRSRIAALERERDTLKSERDDLVEERDRLESRIEQLKERVDELESSTSSASSGRRSDETLELSSEEALSGTSLFVRYHSQSHATLNDAYQGDAHPEEVNENLMLEQHTTFAAENAVVNGVPYEDFLTDSVEYAVVSWIVRDLLYDIYEAEYEDDLADLYDYIQDIDRAALHATNTTDDDTSVFFDVVCFDQRGDPLIVVRIHDSRDPTTAQEAESLLDEASAAADQWPLTAALLVTTSYFDANAFDTAADATTGGGGLFSSSNRESYVRLSRKHGFHLLLVEARQRQFHVAVPKL